MIVAKHLTDRQKKKIIADYAELWSYRAVARKHKVSDVTVKRICERDLETTQNIAKAAGGKFETD